MLWVPGPSPYDGAVMDSDLRGYAKHSWGWLLAHAKGLTITSILAVVGLVVVCALVRLP